MIKLIIIKPKTPPPIPKIKIEGSDGADGSDGDGPGDGFGVGPGGGPGRYPNCLSEPVTLALVALPGLRLSLQSV